MTALDDHALAADLAERAGRLLLDLRAKGGDPDSLRNAGDRQSHEFLMAELAKARPDDAVLSEEGTDDKARLTADRVWIVDPLDGTRDYYRARFGIGRPPGRMDPAAFVLKDFSAPERKELPFALDRCADAVEALIAKGLVEAQNEYHTDPA